jgi:hypothetical protein
MMLPRELPSLEGRRGRIVRGLFLLLSAFVLLATIGGLVSEAIYDFRDVPGTMRYGILVGSDDAWRPVVDRALPSASAMGIRAGDRIVAIDGDQVAPGETQFGVAERLIGAGPIATLDLVDARGHLSRHRVRRTTIGGGEDYRTDGIPVAIRQAIDFGNGLFGAIFFPFLSITLFRRRPRDPEAVLLAIAFMMFAFDSGYEGALLSGSVDPAVAGWLHNSFGVVSWWCLLVALCAFPDGRFRTPWSRFACLIPTAYAIGNMLTNFRLWQIDYAANLVEAPMLAATAIALLLRYRGLGPGTERQQLKVATFGGIAVGFASAATALTEMPPVVVALSPTATYALGVLLQNVLVMSYPLALLIALLRLRLYDADNAINRSAGYGLLTLSLVGVFACTEQVAQGLGQTYLGDSLGSLASGLGAAAAAIMIAPLHQRILGWTERRFRSDLVNLRRNLPLLVGDMREIASAEVVAEAVLARVEKGVRATHGAIIVGGEVLFARGIDAEATRDWLLVGTLPLHEDDTIHVDRGDPLFPMRVPLHADGVGLVGWLLLGSRPDGSFYGRDERDALLEIADPLARGLAVTIERQKRDTLFRRNEAIRRQEADVMRRDLKELQDFLEASFGFSAGRRKEID